MKIIYHVILQAGSKIFNTLGPLPYLKKNLLIKAPIEAPMEGIMR